MVHSKSVSLLVVVAVLLQLLSLETSVSGASWCGHDRFATEAQTTVVSSRQIYWDEIDDIHYNQRSIASEPQTNHIRIAFHTLNVLNDEDQRTCYNTQSSVRIGNPSSESVTCSGTVTDNCWKSCTPEIVVSQSRAEIVGEIVEAAKTQLENVLKVVPVEGPLILKNAEKCGAGGGVTIPPMYKTAGIEDTDIIIFVTARPTEESVLGWGVACQDDQNKRAIAGQINISPLLLGTEYKPKFRTAVIVHEILHVLGFSGNSFQHFRDKNGNVYPNVQITESREHKGDTRTITKLATPAVVAAVRKHFDCDTLDGAELEDYGGSGTMGSHWDQRVFLNEIMTGSGLDNPGPGPVLSPITLAALEDSGWYEIDYNHTEPLEWGKNFGCGFVNERCEDSWPTWEDDGISGYFCKKQLLPTNYCTFDHKGKGMCGVVPYQNDLPGYYQHFSNGKLGGHNPLTDFCPYIYRNPNGDCTDKANEDSVDKGTTGEYFGEMSRCFASDLTVSLFVNPLEDLGTRCFMYSCIDGVLYANVGKTWIKCPVDGGGSKRVKGHTGSITCPKAHFICGANETTSNAGEVPEDVINGALPANFPHGSALAFAFGVLVLGLSAVFHL